MPDGSRDAFSQSFWRAVATANEIPGSLAPDSIAPQDYALLADNLPVPAWLARGDGYIVWYNRRWHDYCGTTADAMEGWGWQSVHDPDELPRVLERWAHSIATGEPFEMVFPLRGADGAYRPFLTRVSPLRDSQGNVVRWFGVNVEISAQLKAETALQKSQAALHVSEAKFDVLSDAMPQIVWSTLPDGFHDYYSAQWYAFTGVPDGSTDGEGWNGMFHAEDQDRAWGVWRKSLETGEPYEIEYRLRHRSGEYRWMLGRALPVRDRDGRIVRWIGTCTDIHDAKISAEKTELLSQELSHRIKNIFAIVISLIRQSARHKPDVAGFATEIADRIAALGRAHEFARHPADLAHRRARVSTLHGLLLELFKPYQAFEEGRMTISGVDVPVDDAGATPIALVFHELATNATKYGALSGPNGKVSVTSRVEGDDLQIEWQEAGGPAVDSEPVKNGFGTQLATMSIERQLGGDIVKHWRREGLVVEVHIDARKLTRG